MRKEIKFAAKFDTSDFDKSIDQLQRKLKEIYAPSDMVRAQTTIMAQRMERAGIPGVAAPSQQSKRESDAILRDQFLLQEKLAKMIERREEKLKKLQTYQSEIVKDSKQELEIKEKIAKLEENNFRLRETYKQRDSVLNQTLEAREKAMAQRPPGGGGGPGGGGRGRFGSIMGFVGRGAGALVTAGLTGARIADEFAMAPLRVESARATAIQSTIGQDLAQVYAGRAPFESAFMGERSQASAVAKERADTSRTTDLLKGAFGAALMIGGFAAAPFTGGLSAVAALGAGASGLGMLTVGQSGQRHRERLMGAMGSEESQRQYDQLLAAQQARDFRETLDQLKEQDPRKKLAVEEFERTHIRNVQAQRAMGMTNAQFYGEGGFLTRARDAGFDPTAAIGMAQGILQAGGSSRMAGQAQLGLQMERSGLTNAPQILGTLSGAIQTPEANKRAVISIMSEAFQVGLDSSDFAEENRRFSQAAAEIIGRTGASTESGQTRLTDMFGMFLGERTSQGISAAQTAYEEFQQRGSQVGGRRGAIRFAEAMRDPSLSKLGMLELNELLSTRPEDLESNPAALAYFSEQTGLSEEDLLKKMRSINKSSRFMIPEVQKRVEQLSTQATDWMSKEGVTWQEFAERGRKGELPPEMMSVFGGLQVFGGVEERGGIKADIATARAGEFIGGGAAGRQITPFVTPEQRAERALEEPGGRIEDLFINRVASTVDTVRATFLELNEELKKAAGAASAFTQATTGKASEQGRSSEERRASMPSGDPYTSDIHRAMTQTQADIGRPGE